MKRLLIAHALLAFAAIPATAAEPPIPPAYTLTVSPQDVDLIGTAINELPAKLANPLAKRLMDQISAQQAAFAQKAAEAAKPAEPKE